MLQFFFATYLLLLVYSSAKLLKQCNGAIVRFSDSSSYSGFPLHFEIECTFGLIPYILPSMYSSIYGTSSFLGYKPNFGG